ncbi:hypothetical protein [Chroococcidiopsis thermalis]|uniref:hypothetical protein n=1 Tax=Chroococcidiopsis thermalis TaxID=54299 RepID=UPI0002EEB5F6|nr:hypothetical protein [Chroococcidiopsis thermalis]
MSVIAVILCRASAVGVSDSEGEAVSVALAAKTQSGSSQDRRKEEHQLTNYPLPITHYQLPVIGRTNKFMRPKQTFF